MIALVYADAPFALQMAARLLMALLCCGVILASVCRVAAMEAGKRHAWSWAVCYVLYGAAAADMLIYVAGSHVAPNDASALAITALAANVLLTRKSWAHRPPKITEKQS